MSDFQEFKNGLARHGVNLSPYSFSFGVLILGGIIAVGFLFVGIPICSGILFLMVLIVIFQELRNVPRISALEEQGRALGLSFSSNDTRNLDEKFRTVSGLIPGGFAPYNILKGSFGGHRVLVFDARPCRTGATELTEALIDVHPAAAAGAFAFQTLSKKSAITVCLLDVDGDFPGITLTEETKLDKAARTAGFEDVNFDNFEFSEKYKVWTKDKKFAYAFFTPKMMEHFLEFEGWFDKTHGKGTMAKYLQEATLSFEVRKRKMVMLFPVELSPSKLKGCLERLVGIPEAMEGYVLKDYGRKKKKVETEEKIPGKKKRKRKKSASGKGIGTKKCPKCGEGLQFMEEHDDSYCEKCDKYLSERGE